MKDIEKVVKILNKKVKDFKDPAMEKLSFDSPFKVLISCVLSLRTKDEVTVKAAKRLLSKASNPEKLSMLNVKEIKKLIYPVGFYKTKARTIKEISKLLIKKYNSEVPRDFDELLKLKGVGRKTANIVMQHGFGRKDVIPVDVHVHVVANRLGWVNTKDEYGTEKELMNVVPKRYWKDVNYLFVIYGQNICLTRKPRCWECPVSKYCKYYREIYLKKDSFK